MLKTRVKNLVYALAAKQTPALLRAVNAAQTVSFDVFDTLIKRDVIKPADAFALLEKQLAQGDSTAFSNFAHLRVQAERQARAAHPGQEVTLAEIYACLPLAEPDRAAAMQAECRLEVELSTPNLALKPVYDECVRQGKAVYFISDMYLPGECIEAILHKNGYAKGKLYVSSQIGVTKHSGELFRRVAQAEGLTPKTWMHIGDSISSDWLTPKRLGIRSVLIRHDLRNTPYVDRKTAKTNKDYCCLNHFISNRIDRYTDQYERIGYSVLGPLLYGFAHWLEQVVPPEETMVFLARDAAILQRAFTEIFAQPSIYFYVSRDAVRLPSVYCIKEETALAEQQSSMRVPVLRELVNKYGLTDEEIKIILQKSEMNLADYIRSEEEKRRILKMIVPLVQEKAQEQYELLQRYISQEEFPQRCALVDIGWNGTIQKLLTECRFTAKGETIQWSGYYIGSFEKEKNPRYQNLPRKQYLFEKNVNCRIYDSVKYSRFFFELLFLATHGSTKEYFRNDEGKIQPKLGEPDNLGEMNEKIDHLQNAALQFVADMAASPLRTGLALDAKAAAGNYVALARVPSRKTLALFKSFEYEDGRICRFVSIHGAGYYLLHCKEFYREFIESPCKAWFLKSVFKIPLPYIQMLNFLRRLTKQ